jgi:hypothetical protein
MALDMCMISEETVNFRQNTAVRPDQERKPQPGLNLGSALYLHGSMDTSVDRDATSLIIGTIRQVEGVKLRLASKVAA